MIEREVMPDIFSALIKSIVSQQISNKAAVTVWNRLIIRFGEIIPARIADASVEAIQQCGITLKKANYIKNISTLIGDGVLNLSEISKLPDEDVRKRLSELNGIGVWTAEMLMIFSMQRPDVVSWGDLAIRRGMMMLYHHRRLEKAQFEKYRKRYSPCGSVASLYLWEIAAGR